MSTKDVYKTIRERSESLLIEKKSKFIASVKPVDNEKDAIDFVNEIRSLYPDATHNVYAYVIDENNIFRYSDDGEPSGTAGMPVLDAIRKAGIVDAAVVVTRYFGGTLLGTGGLVHTYGASAKQGLEASKIVVRQLCDIISVRVDYTLLGKMQHEIMSKGYILEDTVYADNVSFIIACPVSSSDRVIAEITDMTNARAVCEKTDKKYVDMEAKEE
ncbi:MAG: YigZ family protein [Oscillospiraceae bacterium]|nr:YigZ family protein [Oscillospiraceae bacterium]